MQYFRMPTIFWVLVLVNVANAAHSWYRYAGNHRGITLFTALLCSSVAVVIYVMGLQSQRYEDRAVQLRAEIAASQRAYRERLEQNWNKSL
jgi:hypothetical protein